MADGLVILYLEYCILCHSAFLVLLFLRLVHIKWYTFKLVRSTKELRVQVKSLLEHWKTIKGQSYMGNQHMEKGIDFPPVSWSPCSDSECVLSHSHYLPIFRKIQSVFGLSDGSGLAVTVARYETPAHTDIDKVSIATCQPVVEKMRDKPVLCLKNRRSCCEW